MADYQRDKAGQKLDFHGMNLLYPVDRIPAGKMAFAQNVRRIIGGAIAARPRLSAALFSMGAFGVHSLGRMNDSTPNGPAQGYTLIGASGTTLYNNSEDIADGMSGDQVSIIPFRPNASVQPWAYIGDNSENVTIHTKSLTTGVAVDFNCFGMVKVRSDGLIYKMGIKEPQTAPEVSTDNVTVSGTDLLPATSVPWTNVGGQNVANFGYGQTNAADGTAPVIVTGGASELIANSTIVLTVSGIATVNGANHTPGDAGPTGTTFPGNFIAGATIVVGCFTDASGNVLAPGGTIPSVFPIGNGTTLTVPSNAAQLQVGIDSSANTFSANSGSFTLHWAVTINPIATKISTLGQVTAYVWGTPPPSGGGSPHSGPVATYIWKNPGDIGSGTPRSITDPIPDASPTNNSWQFDSTPEDGTVPVNWDVLNADGTVSSSIPLFDPQLETEGYQDFNVCIVGSLFVPAAGTHTFTFKYKDQILVGMSGGASSSLGKQSGPFGQTMTVASGLPLVFASTSDGGGTEQTTNVDISFTEAGIYQIEVDWDYWEHTGRSMVMTVDGAAIPPISANVRQEVQYRYVYRSSATGAASNPSPESTAQSLPVVANSVTSFWSNDPQVDLVDYYRIDQNVANFTYVATGPNDNSGNGTNTPIVDLTNDDDLSDQLLEEDNFEPFPSIDLPQKGIVNVSGGVITWVSGGAIGGTQTGFNTRWLAGTNILIGSPTAVSYIFVARPISNTQVAIPGVPDGTGLEYVIDEPILAAQPLQYLFGPTDNINFTFGVGDPLRPGTLYWCSGSNLDAAPDTNQLDVTDPSEPLVNGAMSGGRGVLFSIKRAWVIMPNFFNALATATGTQGSTWTLQAASIDRGLFIPRCLAVEGGGTIFFRVEDGIHASPGGLGSKSITDDDLYPLFSHEGSTPQPVMRAGNTVYPPDDTHPEFQRFSISDNYLYYDYHGTDGGTYTLVFDIAAMGWVWDVYTPAVSIHAPSTGESSQGTLVGCNDGSIRQFSTSGTEVGNAIALTPAWDKGDSRADGHWGDTYIEIGNGAQ